MRIYNKLCKYNFSSNAFEVIYYDNSDSNSDSKAVGLNGDNMYFINFNADDIRPTKLNLSNGKTENLNINANEAECEVKDMATLKNSHISLTLIPVSDNYFVFYDETAKAFRTLGENK